MGRRFSLFLSHSSKDDGFVQKLKRNLREYFHVWVDDDTDCLSPGDSLLEKIETALNEMTHFLIVCSPASMESDWVTKELRLAQERLARRGIARIIPIKYKTCQMGRDLGNLVYADFSSVIFVNDPGNFRCARPEDEYKYGEEFAKIVQAVAQTAPVELKPVTPKRHDSGVIDIYIKLVGYKSGASKRARAVRAAKERPGLPASRAKPVVFPGQFRRCGISVGSPITCEYNGKRATGHLAGYGVDTRRLVLPAEMRSMLQIKNLLLYRVKVDAQHSVVRLFDP